MNKNLLTIVGVAAFIGIGYYLWKSSKGKNEVVGEKPPKCLENEYEQEVECDLAPCPTICVKKRNRPALPDMSTQGFTGGTGSFFNPKRGRNQDTSF